MSQHLIIRLLAVTLLAFTGIALLRRDIQVATLSAIGAMLGLTWNPPQPRPRRAGSPLTPPPTDGQTGNSRQSAVHHSPARKEHPCQLPQTATGRFPAQPPPGSTPEPLQRGQCRWSAVDLNRPGVSGDGFVALMIVRARRVEPPAFG